MVYKENIIKTRPYASNIQIGVEKIRKRYGIELPKYFALFCETFEFGEVRSEDYLDDYGNLTQIGGLGWSKNYSPYFEEFHGFNGYAYSYNDMLNLKIIGENKLWVIAGGEMSWEQFICASTKEPNLDKIVKVDAFHNTIEECEENIFDFLNDFVFAYFNGLTDFDNLIRFWGEEDYWKQKDKLHIEYNNSGRNHEPIPRIGFTFIGIRPKEDENNIKDLLGDITLPFRVNTFLTYFKFEGKKGLKTFDIYDEKVDQYIRFETINYSPIQLDGENIIIDELYIDEQIATSVELFKTSNQGFLEIGKTQSGHGINLGLQGEKSEEIWLVSETPLNDNGDLMIKLADDIFKFIRGLEPIYKEEYFDKIYRNWGEDFWRIQENEA
jgi:hypothetical protein